MKQFFSTAERIAQLEAEARSWVGTPFAPHAAVKGAGVDCVHLVAAIYQAVGALKDFSPPNYALDEGSHLKASKVFKWFEGRRDFEQVWHRPPVCELPDIATLVLPGDTLCFRFGPVEHHAGLMLTAGNFLHALPGRVATISNLRESFYRCRITAIYRPMEVVS